MSSTGWIAGVYPLFPKGEWRPAEEDAILDACRALPGFGGFELPFTGTLHHRDERWLVERLRPGDHIVLTLIPGVVARLADDPAFGLASRERAARARAVDFADEARAAVRRINDRLGERAVVAVELHSAPTAARADTGALALSLHDLAVRDWDGARLTIEHCDAPGPGTSAKGFLTIDDELDALRQANAATAARLGLVVNWGRSAIEGRDARHPLRHIARAREAGLLAGLMFSGVSDRPDSRGGAWGDVHLAPREALGADPHSLLDVAAATAALAAAGGPELVGLKISAAPDDTTADRIRILRDSVASLFG